MQPPRSSAYRPDVDGLRAIAVVSVILYHLGFRGLEGGFVGVDVFFVISGFLITRYILTDLESGTFSFGRFYIRRVRRLFPALFVTLAGSFVVGFFLLSPDHFKRLSRSLIAALASVSNIQFWSESGYFDARAHVKPLLHTWSLGVEEQFYFVWPLTLTALWRLGRARTVVAFLIVSAIVSLYVTERWLQTDAPGAFYLAPFRVSEFAVGALCVWTVGRQPEHAWLSDLLVALGLLAVMYAVVTFGEGTAFPGVNALIPCLGTAAVIQGGVGARRCNRLLANRLAVGIGLISYSLYLAHWPLYVFYRYWKAGPLTMTERLAIVPASIACAVLMYFYVERPFRIARGRSGRLKPAAFAAACAVLAIVLAVPAGAAWRNAGWEWRAPAEITDAVGDPNLFNAARRTAIRSPACHMSEGFERFAPAFPHCLQVFPHRTNIIVLGDSHAADLWASLQGAYPTSNFLQATGAACLPIESRYSNASDACAKLIRHVRGILPGRPKLEGVILGGRWSKGFPAVMADVAFYRSIGLPVAVFGPVVEFDPDVRTLAYRFGKRDGLADFVAHHRVAAPLRLDRSMRAFFIKHDVPYVSAIDLFCRGGTCPVLDGNGRLLVQDYGHWGVEAMKYFGREVARDFERPQALFALRQNFARVPPASRERRSGVSPDSATSPATAEVLR